MRRLTLSRLHSYTVSNADVGVLYFVHATRGIYFVADESAYCADYGLLSDHCSNICTDHDANGQEIRSTCIFLHNVHNVVVLC
jgi:hypothetical protein